MVDCVNHLNFVLNRVEARVNIIKELTLIEQILDKYSKQITDLNNVEIVKREDNINNDQKIHPDVMKVIEKIKRETKSRSDRISFLKETSDINKANILNEIKQFKKLIVNE